MQQLKKIKKSAQYIKKKIQCDQFDIAVVFGSGLSPEELSTEKSLHFHQIPHYPVSTVKGHGGRIILQKINDLNVLFFLGRVHFYEGYSPGEVVYPIRVMKECGVKRLFITNAAGALNPDYTVGDLMIIKDHINLTGENPLIGANLDEHGPRFPDMSCGYSLKLIEQLKNDRSIRFREGVYLGVSGPSYETPAEVSFFRKTGGDAVGMSTVMEVITANHCGMETLGVSCITNATGADAKLNHREVVEVAGKSKKVLFHALIQLIRRLA